MSHRFAKIAFTPSVRRLQEEMGSLQHYERMLNAQEPLNHRLTEAEAGFVAARDSFYMATVSETGWPYIQHRGGPVGFVHVIDSGCLGFADFRGNRQYVSVGNLMTDDRVSLFFMDYPNRTRLKLFGRARMIGSEEGAMLSRLERPDYRARVERGIIITVEGFDWNCPQHITPRHTAAETSAETAALLSRIATLEDRLSRRPASGSEPGPAQ